MHIDLSSFFLAFFYGVTFIPGPTNWELDVIHLVEEIDATIMFTFLTNLHGR